MSGDGDSSIFILSDGTGETASTMIRAALVQYADKDINIVRCKNVRTEEQIESLIEDVYARKGIIVFTMVSAHMSRKVMDTCAQKGLGSGHARNGTDPARHARSNGSPPGRVETGSLPDRNDRPGNRGRPLPPPGRTAKVGS